MAHGYPDYGIYTAKKTVYSLQDMAELAARLGSIVTFDRRGDVIWLDDFEDNINKWGQEPSGVGAAIALSTDAARNGGYSCKLTTGNVAGEYARIIHSGPYPILSKIGFEISFTLDTNTMRFRIGLSLYDGTYHSRASVQYNMPFARVEYVDENGVWQVLDTITPLRSGHTLFHTIKLVVDFVNYKYERLLLDSLSYDLTPYSLYRIGDTSSPVLLVDAIHYTNVDANISNYVDDAIITQNEP